VNTTLTATAHLRLINGESTKPVSLISNSRKCVNWAASYRDAWRRKILSPNDRRRWSLEVSNAESWRLTGVLVRCVCELLYISIYIE
jgi:hypothetical protein